MSLDEAEGLIASAVGLAFPGAVLGVGLAGRRVQLKAFGRLAYAPDAPEVQQDTLYDLASLTKVVVGATIAMRLVDEGALDLDARLSAYLPAFEGAAKDRVTIRLLLAHAAGLPAWAPLYAEVSEPGRCLERIAGMDLVYEPGTQSRYSDLGMILLGCALERIGGASLDVLASRLVLDPLDMGETCYRPAAGLHARIAPTELDPWRGRLLRGEVHDENAAALGGVAAHSGLFGTAGDLALFAQMILDGGAYPGGRLVSRSRVEQFTTRSAVPGTTRALGWDTASDGSGRRSSLPGQPGYSSAGSLFSSRSFGHTGFTGTSLWLDPERGLYLILLSNRVHPRPQDAARGRENDAIRGVRSRLADAVVRGLASG